MKRVKTTTVCLPEELIESLKRAAWIEGRSLSNYVTLLLSNALANKSMLVDAGIDVAQLRRIFSSGETHVNVHREGDING